MISLASQKPSACYIEPAPHLVQSPPQLYFIDTLVFPWSPTISNGYLTVVFSYRINLGSHYACFRHPYFSPPDETGLWSINFSDVRSRVSKLHTGHGYTSQIQWGRIDICAWSKHMEFPTACSTFPFRHAPAPISKTPGSSIVFNLDGRFVSDENFLFWPTVSFANSN